MTVAHHKVRHSGPVVSMLWKTSLKAHSRLMVGAGARQRLADVLGQLKVGKRVLVLYQPSISNRWLADLDAALFSKNYQVTALPAPDGEECKTVNFLSRVWNVLQQEGFGRQDTVVALGGGALCDLSGFAASTYLRGINLVLAPTTLLAQVDAAIGGKNGINLGAGKNLSGTFYFPQAVLIDPDFLSSLPPKQLTSGLAEIIKYALIEETVAEQSSYKKGPRPLLEVLEQNLSSSFAFDNPVMTGLLTSCIKMKLAVAAADPLEDNLRRCLNLGHTLGHALEKASNYELLHGQAVAIGLIFACQLSVKRNLISLDELDRLKRLVIQSGLPDKIPADIAADKLLEPMVHDKKRQDTVLKFVLPESHLGRVDFSVNIAVEDLPGLLA